MSVIARDSSPLICVYHLVVLIVVETTKDLDAFKQTNVYYILDCGNMFRPNFVIFRPLI